MIESYHSQPGAGWFRRSRRFLNQCGSLLARGLSKTFVESGAAMAARHPQKRFAGECLFAIAASARSKVKEAANPFRIRQIPYQDFSAIGDTAHSQHEKREGCETAAVPGRRITLPQGGDTRLTA
jgi:hypothetical protein